VILPDLPEPVYRDIATCKIRALSPAWIKLGEDGCSVESSGGSWQRYFDTAPVSGMPVTELCHVLDGLLPFHDSFDLPQIQLKEEIYTDIHAFY
jgi:hypothetical protein